MNRWIKMIIYGRTEDGTTSESTLRCVLRTAGALWRGGDADDDIVHDVTRSVFSRQTQRSLNDRPRLWGCPVCVCGHVCVHVCVCGGDSMCACVRVHSSCSPTLRHGRWPFHNLQRAILHRRLPGTSYFSDFVGKTTTSSLRLWVGFPPFLWRGRWVGLCLLLTLDLIWWW